MTDTLDKELKEIAERQAEQYIQGFVIGEASKFVLLSKLARTFQNHYAAVGELRAELAALKAQDEWQPMSTVPKDGSSVHLGFAHMRGFDVIAHWSAGDWSLTGDGDHAVRLHGRPQPSGWKPLGPPPSPEMGEK